MIAVGLFAVTVVYVHRHWTSMIPHLKQSPEILNVKVGDKSLAHVMGIKVTTLCDRSDFNVVQNKCRNSNQSEESKKYPVITIVHIGNSVIERVAYKGGTWNEFSYRRQVGYYHSFFRFELLQNR
jgi:hypothetical protein